MPAPLLAAGGLLNSMVQGARLGGALAFRTSVPLWAEALTGNLTSNITNRIASQTLPRYLRRAQQGLIGSVAMADNAGDLYDYGKEAINVLDTYAKSKAKDTMKQIRNGELPND